MYRLTQCMYTSNDPLYTDIWKAKIEQEIGHDLNFSIQLLKIAVIQVILCMTGSFGTYSSDHFLICTKALTS